MPRGFRNDGTSTGASAEHLARMRAAKKQKAAAAAQAQALVQAATGTTPDGTPSRSRRSVPGRPSPLDSMLSLWPQFNAPTWAAWRTALKAAFGLRLTDKELAIYRERTKRTTAPAKQVRELWDSVGRQGGKSQVAGLLGAWYSVQNYDAVLAPGEMVTIPVIASDRKQGRIILRYIIGLLESVPELAARITRQTADTLELGRVAVEIHTASFKSTRGYACPLILCDEIAFWKSEDSANPDVEILNGLRPSQQRFLRPNVFPRGLLVAISTPYSKRGELWRMYREHFSKEGDPVLFWTGSTLSMNPAAPADVIEAAYRDDASAASAEYGGEFRGDVQGFLDDVVIQQAVIPDRHELPPASMRYVAFCDPSGGSQDSMTLAVAHKEHVPGALDKVVLDVVLEARPPFDPQEVCRNFADVLRMYGISRIAGDNYSGVWVVDAFRSVGIYYCNKVKRVDDRLLWGPELTKLEDGSIKPVSGNPLTKSDLYLEALPLFMSNRVELLDHHRLVVQLRGLERKTGHTGKDSVDHSPGGHDDVSNAACGAIVLAGKGQASAPAGGNPRFKHTLIGHPGGSAKFAGCGAVPGSGIGGPGGRTWVDSIRGA